MADPFTILGGIGAAAGIIATITKVVKGLSDLQQKYTTAEASIRQLIRQLMVIKASLMQIQDWTQLNLAGSPKEQDLLEAFKISLEGCQEAIESMSDEVAKLVKDALAGDQRTMRARYVWNEETMKDYQARLDSQVLALQLLLAAVQCRTATEQTALLREPQNRRIVQKIRDDTSSLRANSIYRPPTVRSPSVLSSTIGSTVFDVDNDIVNSDVYRRALLAHQRERARSADERHRRPPGNPGPNNANGMTRLVSADSGFAEWSEHSDHLSPIDQRFTRGWERPRPYERSVASDPADVSRQQRRPQVQITSASDSFLPGLNMAHKTKLQKKRSFLPSLFTGSSSTLTLLSPQISGHRRGRRHSDSDIHRSIDLDSVDGRSAPPLVRAAQSGSGIEVEELLDQRVDINAKHDRTGRTALAVASHCGNDDVVAILLRYGAKTNTVDVFGNTPLHLCATRGHYRVVEYLLREDIDVDAPGPEQKTALRLAADNGHLEVVELLLSQRAKVNARDSKHVTALHAAARIGDEEMVNLLLSYKADIEAKDGSFQAAIHHASEKGHERVVDVLLAKKANIEAVGKESMSPLTAACAAGSADVVRLLIQKKASLKHKGDGAMTCLHWASFNGHSDVIDILLEKRLSIDARTNDGRTPLHLAVLADKFATAELLLRKGANVDAVCEDGLRPLHYAARSANADLLQLLLGHGAGIEAETKAGKRPLHYATTQGNPATIDILVRKGAAIDARDGAGDRPLCLASAEGHIEVVRLLLDRGAEMRTRYSRGPSHEDSPLCIAAKNGHLAVVEELVRRGASVRQRDEANWQPLRYAAYFAHPDVVQYLLAIGASISGLDTPGSFGFNLTATRIGFANNPEIDEYRRQAVTMQLHDAEIREQESLQSSVRRRPSVRSPQQDFPLEKDNDTEGSENYTSAYPAYRSVHIATAERQELPSFQRSPREEPRPFNPPSSETSEDAEPERRGVTHEDRASSPPPPPPPETVPPPSSQASRYTLDPSSSVQPRWRPVAPPVPPSIPRPPPPDSTISPLPSFIQGTASPIGAVSPLPSQSLDSNANRSSPPQLAAVPQSPNRPPPPAPRSRLRDDPDTQRSTPEGESREALSIGNLQANGRPALSTNNPYARFVSGDHSSQSSASSSQRNDSVGSNESPRSPPPPTRSAPLPPDLPPIPDPEDAIVVCDACGMAGRTSTDLSCGGCREALYMYHHIMSGDSSFVEPVVTMPDPRSPAVHEPIYELA